MGSTLEGETNILVRKCLLSGLPEEGHQYEKYHLLRFAVSQYCESISVNY